MRRRGLLTGLVLLTTLGVVALLFLENGERFAGVSPPGDSTSADNKALAAPTHSKRAHVDSVRAVEPPRDTNALRDCAFFESRLNLRGTPPLVEEFLETVGSIEQVALDCVPAEWLLIAVILHCEGKHQLSQAEIDALRQALSSRMPDPQELSHSEFPQFITPASIECLIANTLSKDASLHEIAGAWAWWLVAAFGGEGGYDNASPEVVAALAELMIRWPLNDDEWWGGLWDGLPDGIGLEGLRVRCAMFDALHARLPQDQWLARMAALAELEDAAEVGGIASLAMSSMGVSLERHLSRDELVALLGDPGTGAWSRVLVSGFPPELQWPAASYAEVPWEVRSSLIALRDAPDYPYRMDIIYKQWGLLGPLESTLEVERFVFNADRAASGWEWEAVSQVTGVIDALHAPSPNASDADILQHAGELVRELFDSCSPAERRDLLNTLRDRRWLSSQDKRRRQELIELLGADLLSELDTDLRLWLESE